MNTQTLLEALHDALDKDGASRRKRIDALKKILKKLKHKRDRLKDKVKDSSGVEKDKLKKKLDLIHAQRKKGIKALKHLKKK